MTADGSRYDIATEGTARWQVEFWSGRFYRYLQAVDWCMRMVSGWDTLWWSSSCPPHIQSATSTCQ